MGLSILTPFAAHFTPPFRS